MPEQPVVRGGGLVGVCLGLRVSHRWSLRECISSGERRPYAHHTYTVNIYIYIYIYICKHYI
jgi:hypothetical protein